MEKEVMIGGRLYETIQIGNQLWLNENLKSTSHGKGKSWDNDAGGRLYDWDAAMSLALPEGWRLPSSEDWDVLGIVHDGWKLQFGGYRPSNGSGFYNLGSNGYWWSSTPSSSDYAWGRGLGSAAKVGTSFSRPSYDRSTGFSVRCVRDLPEEKIERIANLSLNEEQAINFLKSKGYRILKPIVNYEEV